MQDLEKGCFDFNSNTLIDNNFFKDKRNHSLRVLKILTDFIRCNKFYEDIPIYQTEYKEFAQILKHFLINYYDSSSTIEEEIINEGGGGGGGVQSGIPVLFIEQPTPYEKQETSFARLQLMIRAQQGKIRNERLIAKVKQLLV